MKSVLRATAVLGGSSAVAILAGAISAKAWSYFLGPGGYGVLGLEQSMVKIATLVAALGMGTALVRGSAHLIGQARLEEALELQHAASVLAVVLGLAAAAAMTLGRRPLARWLLGGTASPGAVALLGVALALTVVYDAQTGILNAHLKVKALAIVAGLGALSGAVVGVALVAVWRNAAIAPAVLGLALANCLAAQIWLQRCGLGFSRRQPWIWPSIDSYWGLLRFGAPYTVSTIAGTGVQFALPFLVLHMMDAADVGFYRAAALITVTYASFLLNAMAKDYYPRLVADDAGEAGVVRLINEQHRAMLMLGAPVVLFMLALVPFIVPLLYTRAFMPAATLLEWQLAGDVFKLSSWTVSFAILARCRPSAFLVTEVAGGAVMLVACWAGLRLWGLDGVGIGYVAAYIFYFALTQLVLRRSFALRWTRANRRLLATLVAAVALVRLLPSTPWAAWRGPAAALLALAFLCVDAPVVLAALRARAPSAEPGDRPL